MKVFLATDHAGFELKEDVKEFLKEEGYEVEDCGAYEYDGDDDYPDFIIPCAGKVAENEGSSGIIFGGSGQGEAIAANKVRGVRAMVFYGPMLPTRAVDIEGRGSEDPFELIRLSKEHNNANVLSLAVRFLDSESAKKAVKMWLESPWTEVPRHLRRIEKISEYEE